MAPSGGEKRDSSVLGETDASSSRSSASHSTPTTSAAAKKHRSRLNNAGIKSSTTRNTSPRRLRRAADLRTPDSGCTRVVTPSQAFVTRGTSSPDDASTARRSLLESPGKPLSSNNEQVEEAPKAKRRLAFGRLIVETPCQKNVQDVYKIINKLTGSVGGNGSFGAIYGELTVGSMQKIVDLMKIHTGFSSTSRFIDVGSGLGKPSIHVCQNPGVEFSYGIEMEMSRWMLGMSNLQATIKAAQKQQASGEALVESEAIGSNCFFDHGNIMDAMSFDCFTHVYMFSIGFPPRLWEHLAEMFNRSSSLYLICYHSPSDIIERYGFDVKLVVQAPTSMHGSSEGHMGYIYVRNGQEKLEGSTRCDPLFKDAWDAVKGGRDVLQQAVEDKMERSCHNGRMTRSRGVTMTAVSSIEQKELAEKEAKKNGKK